jgi:acetyl-CoA synthetase
VGQGHGLQLRPGRRAHRWFEGGKLNVSYNCLDRHLDTRGDQVAIIWEGDNPDEDRKITYRELHEEVCKLANVMKARGVSKGDRVCIYLPMIPEAAVAMLACTRIGAVHSIVFGGFSPDSLRDRIHDSECKLLITSDESVRGGRNGAAEEERRQGARPMPERRHLHRRAPHRRRGAWTEGRDVWYHEAMAAASAECEPEPMDAEDPLFILYTSGSTGKPKGVLHTTGGYLVYAAMTHKYTFDYQDGEVYWCTADVGWVTGHTYIVYGPLANGAISLMFEGIPNYPGHVALLAGGRQAQRRHLLHRTDRDPRADARRRGAGQEDLAQEPAHPRHRRRADQPRGLGVVSQRGRRRALPHRRYLVADRDRRPSDHAAAGRHAAQARLGDAPFFGVVPALVDRQGTVLEGAAEGALVITRPWPAQMRTVYGDHQRFIDTYFKQYPGYYFSGDGAAATRTATTGSPAASTTC